MTTLLSNNSQKALTTLARAKSYLGIASDNKDTLIKLLINIATGFIEKQINRNLLSQTYAEEEYDGKGTPDIVLKNYPVTTFTLLQFNTAGDNSDNWETINASKYFAEEDGRIRLVGSFIQQKHKYRATYVAGFLIDFDNENVPASHTLPQDIEYVCLKLVSSLFNIRRAEGFKSAKVGDQSITLMDTVFSSPEIKEILATHKNHNF